MPEKELVSKISLWVDDHREELLRDIARLCAVKSARGEAIPGAPFGPGPRAALCEALKLCGEYGFETAVYGDAVGSADLDGSLPAGVDILGHLDVVGEGDGWDTDPYTCVLKDDGCFYGRGTDDDKGPVVMALFAMRCLRELGLPLRSNARLIMGTDEESGSGDLPYYYKDHAPAPGTFTPDSGFPLYNVEKGSYKPVITRSWAKTDAMPRVSSFEGGFRINVIPSDAKATVAGMDAAQLKALAAPAVASCGVEARYSDVPGGAELAVHGKQAHAASPWDGNNGLTALLTILDSLPLADCESTAALRALARLLPHGDFLGKALGVAQKDEVSGDLTLSFTLLTFTEEGVHGQFDSRVPVCGNDENVRAVAEKALRDAGFAVEGGMDKPHHTPADSEFVRTLLGCYETYTGKEGKCLYTGGGTYVHDIPGGVAFGAGMADFDSHLHGANERINVSDSLTAVKIFALALAELCAEM